MLLPVLVSFILIQGVVLEEEDPKGLEGHCRDRSGLHQQDIFNHLTCAACYGYLFPVGKELTHYGTFLVALNSTVLPTVFKADHTNASIRARVCLSLDDDECERWSTCCTKAAGCCLHQLAAASHDVTACPRTWDGYACWEETSAGQEVTTGCPAFIQHALPSVKATKICDSNGTWYKDPVSQLEWTNYTRCTDTGHVRTGIIVSVSCNLISLAILVPSVIVFCAYKSLRSQHRIRLHINLFISFIFSGVVFILWDLLVFYDRLVKPATLSLMHTNSGGCKLLYVLTRYTRSTNFLWMGLEGFYLHRLIVNAFEPPRSLMPLYFLGWGIPWLPVSIYSSIHAVLEDTSCWVMPFGPFEWIIYIPNLISLAANLVFLVNILRILMTQIQVHPNEPSNYRRALKATCVLVPLFGLQLIFIIYRPPPTAPGASIFEIISLLIVNLQGFFVALIFCFLNGEVLGHIRKTFERLHNASRYRSESKPSLSLATQLTTDVCHRRSSSLRSSIKSNVMMSNKSYIPMKAVAH